MSRPVRANRGKRSTADGISWDDVDLSGDGGPEEQPDFGESDDYDDYEDDFGVSRFSMLSPGLEKITFVSI